MFLKVVPVQYVRKPALLRVAPLMLLAYAAYSLLWVIVGLASGPDISYHVVGVPLSWRESLIRALPVDALGVVTDVALAIGFWVDRPWARPLAVCSPSALLVLQLLLLLPDLGPLPALLPSFGVCALITAIAYLYLYRNSSVVGYYEQANSEWGT